MIGDWQKAHSRKVFPRRFNVEESARWQPKHMVNSLWTLYTNEPPISYEHCGYFKIHTSNNFSNTGILSPTR
jgi:hypothetical protein